MEILILKIRVAEQFELRTTDLNQACTTYVPRAKCGPHKILIWPAKPKKLLLSLIITPLNVLKRNNFGPWMCQKKFWARHEISVKQLLGNCVFLERNFFYSIASLTHHYKFAFKELLFTFVGND